MAARAKKAAPPTVSTNGNGGAPKTFTYTFKADDKIDLPLDFDVPSYETPEGRIWLFDYHALPAYEQIWIWLRRANIAPALAHRIVALPLDKQLDLVSDWLKARTGVSLPE